MGRRERQESAPRVADSVRWGALLVRPSKIICIGLNYVDHAKESGMDLPKEPVVSFKATSSLVGPNDNLVIPRTSQKTDWEVELAIVIGKKATYVSEADALDHIAGYALHNDYSERAFQLERGGQWVKGKSADTFAPLGPFIATRDEITNLESMAEHVAQGERRVAAKNGTTSNLVFGIKTLVSYVSQFMSLLPGDVISTGIPAGVGNGMKPPVFLKAGDANTLGIEGLGEQRQQSGGVGLVVRKPTRDCFRLAAGALPTSSTSSSRSVARGRCVAAPFQAAIDSRLVEVSAPNPHLTLGNRDGSEQHTPILAAIDAKRLAGVVLAK